MKIYQQSPQLAQAFRSTVQEKVSQKRQAVQEAIGNPFWGLIGAGLVQLQDMSIRLL